ncbi:MAG: hypothetical protein AB7M12_05005 [Hyphomonadaceae bacterium]
MRPLVRAAALAAMLFALACSPAEKPAETAQSSAAPADCARVVRRTIAFTAPDAQDVIEARAIGPDCDAAVVVFSLRRADGAPLWAMARAHAWARDPGGAYAPSHDAAAMDAFLTEWANARQDTTAALPDWPERENVFKDQLGGLNATPLPREQYLDVRRQGAPRLCFAADAETIDCIYYDAQKGEARKILEIGS